MSEPTPTVESGIAIGALGVSRRVILRPGKDDISFQVAIDSTADRADIYGLMDTISDVADRERLKSDLSEKRDALRVAAGQPEMMDREVERLVRDRAALLASFQAAHSASKKRLGFEVSDRQQAELDKFAQAIDNAKAQKRQFQLDLPIIRWEIACLEARIGGWPEPQRPEELSDALHEMAQAAE
jgi:hypothetical protein